MALIAPWRQAFCPYCCNSFHLSAAPRRLSGGPREPDTAVGTFLGIAPPDLARVQPVPRRGLLGKLLSRFFIPDDWRDGARKICPYDHMFLPTAAASGHLTPKVVAIIGTRASGKSNFFGVLIKWLKDRFAEEVGFTIFDQETFSVTEARPTTSDALYRKRYYNKLFNPTAPEAIREGTTRASVAGMDDNPRIPLIYRLEFPRRGWLTRWRAGAALDLVIFDAAGEDLRDDDPQTLDQFYRFLLHAAGIIFLVDPSQVKGIRERLPPDMQQRCPLVTDDSPYRLLERVINFFQRRRGRAPGHRIRVPVAFAFSKSDLLEGVVDRGALLHRQSRHPGGFNHADCRQVSDEVARCLSRWGEQRLVTLVSGIFADYSFFALSALGQLPVDTGGGVNRLTKPIQPRRIADPLLWILWRCGYVPEAGA
jgi:hypothetical protein